MKKQIVLGLSNCIDYEILWNSGTFERLILEYNIRDSELSTAREIRCERDLLISILGFFKSGEGGERAVASSEIIENLSRHFEYRVTMGGTSMRAAIAMRKLGYKPDLHIVTVNGHVRHLLPEGIRYICSSEGDSLYPHFIVQFPRGSSIKAGGIDMTARQSNRLIYHDDVNSRLMVISEELGSFLANAKVFLVSGFSSMQDLDLLQERLDFLLKCMERLPKDALVFYEDACVRRPDVNALVRKSLLSRLDIFSLNEDELQYYLKRKIDLLNPGEVLRALGEVREMIPVPYMVVHTRYWALIYGKNAGKYEKALKGGITMATTRFESGDNVTAAGYHEMEKRPGQPEGTLFAQAIGAMAGTGICCLPSIEADESNPTTVGLGDAFVGGFLAELSDLVQ